MIRDPQFYQRKQVQTEDLQKILEILHQLSLPGLGELRLDALDQKLEIGENEIHRSPIAAVVEQEGLWDAVLSVALENGFGGCGVVLLHRYSQSRDS